MSKTLKIVLGVIFTFTAIIYLVNIGAKSFEDANSIGRLISHLVIGVLVGGSVALGLLQAESQQHIAVNRWVTVKLNDHFNVIFITGIVSILAVVISKSAHEVTKSSWYLANEISNNAVAICDEYESSAQVEKSNDKLIKLARAHLSSQEIFLMACENALYENEFNEIYSLKRALTDIELGNIKRGFAVIVRLTEQTNQEKLLKKLVSYNYLTEAEEVAELFDDAKIKVSMLNLVAEKYFKNSDYVQAERLFSSLRSDNYYYGFRGLRRVYDKVGKPEKSVKLYLQLLEIEENSNLDASNTSAWLAYYYDNGLGVAQNLELARSYYENGVSSLSESGKMRLAEMYYDGIGGSVNKEKAFELGYQTDEMKLASKIKKFKKRYVESLDKPNSDYYEYSEDKKLRVLYELFKRNTGVLNLCSNVNYERIGIMKEITSDPYQNSGNWTTYVSAISYDCYSPQLGDQDMDWIFTATCDSRSNTCTCIQGKGVEYATSVIENARSCTRENITL